MKKNKCGFTLIEILIVVTVLATLMVIVAFRYTSSQSRARTLENQKRAQDVTIAIEQFLIFNQSERHYPVKKSGGGFVEADELFLESLPDSSRDNLSTTEAPDGVHPQRLYYIDCRDAVTNYIVGVKVAYWDFIKGTVEVVRTGSTDQTAGVECES